MKVKSGIIKLSVIFNQKFLNKIWSISEFSEKFFRNVFLKNTNYFIKLKFIILFKDFINMNYD
jgi:hypothetical protein